MWKEALVAAELILLRASPVYYGVGVPRGDSSAVIAVPGFLWADRYLAPLHTWLERIGYRSYPSGIGPNVECPDLLIRQRLSQTIDQALADTGRKIHLLGHSLGGLIARSVAVQRPRDIASVIMLAAPFRGTVAHPRVLRTVAEVRKRIREEHGSGVLPDCYTGRCTCEFVNSLRRELPASVPQTAIYTRDDGIVDWRYCRTEDPAIDFEVAGTHIGLPFNVSAYKIMARRCGVFALIRM